MKPAFCGRCTSPVPTISPPHWSRDWTLPLVSGVRVCPRASSSVSAIARAIFADGPVLALDEATSALDEATEARLLSNLRQMTDKTVLIVTHRPAALSIADRTVALAPPQDA